MTMSLSTSLPVLPTAARLPGGPPAACDVDVPRAGICSSSGKKSIQQRRKGKLKRVWRPDVLLDMLVVSYEVFACELAELANDFTHVFDLGTEQVLVYNTTVVSVRSLQVSHSASLRSKTGSTHGTLVGDDKGCKENRTCCMSVGLGPGLVFE